MIIDTTKKLLQQFVFRKYFAEQLNSMARCSETPYTITTTTTTTKMLQLLHSEFCHAEALGYFGAVANAGFPKGKGAGG